MSQSRTLEGTLSDTVATPEYYRGNTGVGRGVQDSGRKAGFAGFRGKRFGLTGGRAGVAGHGYPTGGKASFAGNSLDDEVAANLAQSGVMSAFSGPRKPWSGNSTHG